MSMNFRLADYLSERFVETGTFRGTGVRRALEAGFRQVDTIEVFEPLVHENQERFATEIAQGRVRIHAGDSADMLGRVIGADPAPITFWLDAHIQTMCGGGVGRETCPLLAELRQIARLRAGGNDIVLIDDLRLIEDRQAGWAVDLGELYRLLWEINPGYAIFRIDGHVPRDVLACLPRQRAVAADPAPTSAPGAAVDPAAWKALEAENARLKKLLANSMLALDSMREAVDAR